jgi:hypothetical protein
MTHCFAPGCTSTIGAQLSGVYVCAKHTPDEVRQVQGRKGQMRFDRTLYRGIAAPATAPRIRKAVVELHHVGGLTDAQVFGQGSGLGYDSDQWYVSWDHFTVAAREKICRKAALPLVLAQKSWRDLNPVSEQSVLYAVDWYAVLDIERDLT